MKRIIINESKWICGVPEAYYRMQGNFLGHGGTSLLNDKGFMCCLGHAALQIDKGLSEEDIKGKNSPRDMGISIKSLSKKIRGQIINTRLSQRAIDINDDQTTSIIEKKRRLRKLFAKSGYKLVFSKK